MNDNLITTLKQYGLTEREAKIYLVVLELGSVPAGTIAKYAGENRATVYSVLKELTVQKYVTQITKKGVTYFSVIPPEQLLSKLEQQVSNFKNILPELLAVAEKYDNRPKVQFFEGVDGIKLMYDLTLEYPSSNLYAFLDPTRAKPSLADYLNTVYLPHRIKNHIHAHILLTHQGDNKQYEPLKNQNTQYTTIKFTNSSGLQFGNEVNLFGGDKVSIFNFSEHEMSGIVIQSKSFYQTMYSLFQFIRNKG